MPLYSKKGGKKRRLQTVHDYVETKVTMRQQYTLPTSISKIKPKNESIGENLELLPHTASGISPLEKYGIVSEQLDKHIPHPNKCI